jgi:CheY-like chemotaxis protein
MSASDLSIRAPADVRIVVIDDEIFTLKLMVHILARLGYTNVAACDSGARALQEVSREDLVADLVFLDINMPGMDGVEFIRRLVDLRFCGGIVLVSAENDRIQESVERLVEYHNLKLLGRLGKPVAPKDISGLLSHLHVNPAATGKLRVLPHAYSVEQLRAAIARNELVLHYQPKVAMPGALAAESGRVGLSGRLHSAGGGGRHDRRDHLERHGAGDASGSRLARGRLSRQSGG